MKFNALRRDLRPLGWKLQFSQELFSGSYDCVSWNSVSFILKKYYLIIYGTRKHARQIGILCENYRVCKQKFSASDRLQLNIIIFFTLIQKKSEKIALVRK